MTYLKSRSRTSYGTRTILILSVVFVALVSISLVLMPTLLSSLFMSVARPFWVTEFSVKSGSTRSLSSLLAENEDLRRQIDTFSVSSTSVASIMAENAELKSLLGRGHSSNKITSAVLKRPPLSAYDELVIDAGSHLGVSVSDAVYASGDLLIGRVSQVTGKTSKVVLFSSPNNEIDVLIGQNNVQATAVGKGGGRYEAEISRGLEINEGDVVLASSMNSSFVGTVVSVVSDSASAFKKAIILMPVNVYGLRWVMVESSSSTGLNPGN